MTQLAARNIRVTGSASIVANAIFVAAPRQRVAELAAIPGIQAVIPLRRYKPNLNRAAVLVNAPAAWSSLGGTGQAGAGIKIGILDTGIDQTHPGFQDSSLAMPAGFPICSGSDCNFTNNKVIVARSYVSMIAAGSDPKNPAADSRPDDESPRDRVGHGTAVACVAACVTNTGLVTITGIAPQAWLGNYKIYGSPEVNDGSTEDAIISALDDATKDGMDIASFSSGAPALSGPLDTGAICGNKAGVACDLLAQTFETAAKAGMIIVAAAGNDGQSGNHTPTLNTIESPGDAPSVIAAGATTNSHEFAEVVRANISGSSQTFTANSGDAPVDTGAITAPLFDVAQLDSTGLACNTFPATSLDGFIALIERGTCDFTTKLGNAENAGALAVIFYMSDNSALIQPGGLSKFAIPAVIVSMADGITLKNSLETNPHQEVTIDPAGVEESVTNANQLAGFSSFGPATGTNGIKPDLVAPGTSMYMASQNYDPLGVLYSSTRYAVADGTSFATPVTSGAAALVKQAHPGFSAAQVKSALVNSATQDVTTDDSGNAVGIEQLGAGKLNAGGAIDATVTAAPSTISFGVPSTLPQSQTFTLTNAGSAAATLTLAVAPATQAAGTTISVSPSSVTLANGASAVATVTLAGSVPAAGSYSGFVTVQGTGVSLKIPYLFLEGSSTAANIIPLIGVDFDGTVGQTIPDGAIALKLVDANGVPISGAAVTFLPQGRSGTIQQADSMTDANGIAAAVPVLGATPGNYVFTGRAGGMVATFSGNARAVPNIASIVNAASLQSGAIAPGSMIALMGTALSDLTDAAASATLPLAIDYVHVSFDAPSASLSVPGYLSYVSPAQVHVFVPWELAGQSSVEVKDTIDFSYGNVVTVPVTTYAPAFYEISSSVAATDSSGAVISSSNPAERGSTISLYANGLGPVSNQPASGDPAPSSPLARTTANPVVTIASTQATVNFSELAPGTVGMYQVNITVPASLSPGSFPITIAIGGATSKPSSIAIQ